MQKLCCKLGKRCTAPFKVCHVPLDVSSCQSYLSIARSIFATRHKLTMPQRKVRINMVINKCLMTFLMLGALLICIQARAAYIEENTSSHSIETLKNNEEFKYPTICKIPLVPMNLYHASPGCEIADQIELIQSYERYKPKSYKILATCKTKNNGWALVYRYSKNRTVDLDNSISNVRAIVNFSNTQYE